jgi:hypothetical protein
MFFDAVTGFIFLVFHHLMPCIFDDTGHVDLVLDWMFFMHIVFTYTRSKGAFSDSRALALLVGDDFGCRSVQTIEGVYLTGGGFE